MWIGLLSICSSLTMYICWYLYIFVFYCTIWSCLWDFLPTNHLTPDNKLPSPSIAYSTFSLLSAPPLICLQTIHPVRHCCLLASFQIGAKQENTSVKINGQQRNVFLPISKFWNEVANLLPLSHLPLDLLLPHQLLPTCKNISAAFFWAGGGRLLFSAFSKQKLLSSFQTRICVSVFLCLYQCMQQRKSFSFLCLFRTWMMMALYSF